MNCRFNGILRGMHGEMRNGNNVDQEPTFRRRNDLIRIPRGDSFTRSSTQLHTLHNDAVSTPGVCV